jgi:hypothetical protein
MSELNESINVRLTEEMKRRAEEAAEDGYSGQAEYAREMWLAGESTVGALDPRVSGNTAGGATEIDSAEAAAKALDDTVLLNALSTDEPEPLDEAIEPIMQEFENVVVDRIIELRDDEQSAVSDDGRGNYYLEG